MGMKTTKRRLFRQSRLGERAVLSRSPGHLSTPDFNIHYIIETTIVEYGLYSNQYPFHYPFEISR